MGFNSTVVVMNDSLYAIEEDPEFGKKLANAILSVQGGYPYDVSAGGHCNAAKVIESHHADQAIPVIIGGNMGYPVNGLNLSSMIFIEKDVSIEIALLQQLADKYGFTLVGKKRTKTKR